MNLNFNDNKMELLQIQAPAEWVLNRIECSRMKNLESTNESQESRTRSWKCKGYNLVALSIPVTNQSSLIGHWTS